MREPGRGGTSSACVRRSAAPVVGAALDAGAVFTVPARGAPADQNASICVTFTIRLRPGITFSGVATRCSLYTT